MKRVLGEILGLITGIAGVLFLIGWDDITPLYGVVLVIAFMLLRWIDVWSSGRRRSRERDATRGSIRN